MIQASFSIQTPEYISPDRKDEVSRNIEEKSRYMVASRAVKAKLQSWVDEAATGKAEALKQDLTLGIAQGCSDEFMALNFQHIVLEQALEHMGDVDDEQEGDVPPSVEEVDQLAKEYFELARLEVCLKKSQLAHERVTLFSSRVSQIKTGSSPVEFEEQALDDIDPLLSMPMQIMVPFARELRNIESFYRDRQLQGHLEGSQRFSDISTTVVDVRQKQEARLLLPHCHNRLCLKALADGYTVRGYEQFETVNKGSFDQLPSGFLGKEQFLVSEMDGGVQYYNGDITVADLSATSKLIEIKLAALRAGQLVGKSPDSDTELLHPQLSSDIPNGETVETMISKLEAIQKDHMAKMVEKTNVVLRQVNDYDPQRDLFVRPENGGEGFTVKRCNSVWFNLIRFFSRFSLLRWMFRDANSYHEQANIVRDHVSPSILTALQERDALRYIAAETAVDEYAKNNAETFYQRYNPSVEN